MLNKKLSLALPFILLLAAGGAGSLLWRLSYISLISLKPVPLDHQLMLIFNGFKTDLLGIIFALGVLLLISCLSKWPNSFTQRALRQISRAWSIVFSAALSYIILVRTLDYLHFCYAGSHIDGMLIKHLGIGLPVFTLKTAIMPVLLTALGLLLLILLLLLFFVQRLHAEDSRISAKPVLGLLLGALLLALLPSPNISFSQENNELHKKTYHMLRQDKLFPEIQLLSIFWKLHREKPSQVSVPLSSKVQTKLERFGITVQPEQQYPLVKNWVFKKPLPFPRNNDSAKQVNILLIFLESFSAALTSVYKPAQYPGLTPNLERFSTEALIVKGLYNSSTPTLDGVTSSFCSYLPPFEPSLWYKKENYHKRLNCLPQILRRRGYNTYALLGSSARSLRYEEVLQNFGIENIIDEFRLKTLNSKKPLSWGYSDHQIFGFAEDFLKQQKFKQPFFLMLETIDSHPPFNFAKDVDAFKYEDGTNPLLNTFFSTDHAFGEFWSYFKNSEFFENTIVVAIGDHALFPGTLHKETRKDEIDNEYFDEILAIIRSPFHDLPKQIQTVSAQIDLAPTILHLLNINTLNHFEGLSIFSERKNFPQLIGLHEYLFHTNQLVSGKRVLDYFSLNGEKQLPAVKEECKENEIQPVDAPLSRCEYYQYYRWKLALHHQDRIWPK